MRKSLIRISFSFILAVATLGALTAGKAVAQASSVNAQSLDRASLKDTFKGKFLVGAALNRAQFSVQDARGVALVIAQFNTITPENILKWESVHPFPGKFQFDEPDRYVAFGEKNGMFIVGHTLVWHNQTPWWVFKDSTGTPTTREQLLERMHDHIATVVGRYKGRIKGWDVVNEALEEDGTLRQSQWMKIIGEEYLLKAFQFAHEADPDLELYYNDFSLENAPKRNGAVALIRKLQSQGVHIAAIGLQGHYKMEWPSRLLLDSTIDAFARLGVKVNITELDVDVVPVTQGNVGADLVLNNQAKYRADIYAGGLPDSVQKSLASRYAGLFAAFVKHADAVDRVTFWGVTDADSWLNSGGRVNYPLLFDRNSQPKPAYDAVLKTVR